MTGIVPRPALDPADWRLIHLAVHHQRDLLEPGWPWATISRTRIEAELIPLTPQAMTMVPRLPGHRFTCQGQLFEVIGGYVTYSPEHPVVVSITCEQIHGQSLHTAPFVLHAP